MRVTKEQFLLEEKIEELKEQCDALMRKVKEAPANHPNLQEWINAYKEKSAKQTSLEFDLHHLKMKQA